jgi:hypothetical protein
MNPAHLKRDMRVRYHAAASTMTADAEYKGKYGGFHIFHVGPLNEMVRLSDVDVLTRIHLPLSVGESVQNQPTQ